MGRLAPDHDAQCYDGVVAAAVDQAACRERQFEAPRNGVYGSIPFADAALVECAQRPVLEPGGKGFVKASRHDRHALPASVGQLRTIASGSGHGATSRRWPIFSRFVSM